MDACSVLTIIGGESMESGGLPRAMDPRGPILGLHSVHTGAPGHPESHENAALFGLRPEAPARHPEFVVVISRNARKRPRG